MSKAQLCRRLKADLRCLGCVEFSNLKRSLSEEDLILVTSLLRATQICPGDDEAGGSATWLGIGSSLVLWQVLFQQFDRWVLTKRETALSFIFGI